MTLSAQDRKVDRYPLQTCSGSAVAIETDPNFMLDESKANEDIGRDPMHRGFESLRPDQFHSFSKLPIQRTSLRPSIVGESRRT